MVAEDLVFLVRVLQLHVLSQSKLCVLPVDGMGFGHHFEEV